MRFGKLMQKHLVPEWATQYMDYKGLKKKLTAIKRAYPQEKGTYRTEQLPLDREFAEEIESAIRIVEQFYVTKEEELQKRFGLLQQELEGLTHRKTGRLRTGRRHLPLVETLQQAYLEFYRSLTLLKSYGVLNTQGFTKICKKHDKNVQGFALSGRLQELIHSLHFHQQLLCSEYLHTVESIFTDLFAAGNRHKAMEMLRVEKKKTTLSEAFRLGLYLGLALPALYSIIYIWAKFPYFDGIPEGQAIISLFRGTGLIILTMIVFGLNAQGWTDKNINYVFIFELDPRTEAGGWPIFEKAAFFGMIWLYALFLYLTGLREGWSLWGIPFYVWPPLFFCAVIVVVVIPFDIFDRSMRVWIIKRVYEMVTAPFHSVHFRDFFFADQVNSLVLLLYDLEFTFCYYTADFWFGTQRCQDANTVARAIIAVLPASFRFWQCIRRYRDTRDVYPHLANAAKYSTTFFVATFSTLYKVYGVPAYQGVWIVCATIATLYAYWWDITNDWTVVQWRPFKLFPRALIYERKWIYVLAMVSNFFMRLAWTLVMSPLPQIFAPEMYLTLFGVVELVRRFQWNFFRMENEHTSNCGKFRATTDIPLPYTNSNPLYARDDHDMSESESEDAPDESAIAAKVGAQLAALFGRAPTPARRRSVTVPAAYRSSPVTFMDRNLLDSAEPGSSAETVQQREGD